MLLTTLTTNLQSSYADIQVQIEALQEQQRLIQAQLQRVGSVESKMESAASLIAEAIAEIREVCPEELVAYREVISGLFDGTPVAQIEPGKDSTNDSESRNHVQHTDSTDSTEQVVEVESVTVTVEEGEEEEEECSQQAPARSLHKQPAKPLQWLATKRGVDTSNMKRHQIAAALVGHVTQAELQEAIAQTTKVS